MRDFLDMTFKGSKLTQSAVHIWNLLMFTALTITSFILYVGDRYYKTNYPILYMFNTNSGSSQGKFFNWNPCLAIGIVSTIGLLSGLYELLTVFFKCIPKWDMVSTRWSKGLADSVLTPAIIISLLVEIGEVDLFVLLSIFFLHHISILVSYLVEWDGQSRTTSARVVFDRMLAIFVAILATLPIFLSFTNPSYLTGYTIASSILLLVAGIIDALDTWVYASSLTYDAIAGVPWTKSTTARAAQAIADEMEMRSSTATLVRSDGAPVEARDTSIVVDASEQSNVDKFFGYMLVKDVLVVTIRFVAAVIILVGPAMESDHRDAILRSYSHMCDANTDVRQWGDFGGDDTETCMLDGVLCDYLDDNGFTIGGYDFAFKHLPFMLYGVGSDATTACSTAALTAWMGGTFTPGSPLSPLFGWGSGLSVEQQILKACNPTYNPQGLHFGNTTAHFVCKGVGVAGCKGVSHCPSHGWKEDRRRLDRPQFSTSDTSKVTSVVGFSNAGYPSYDGPVFPPVPSSFGGGTFVTPITSAIREAFAPVNCLDKTKPYYVGVDNSYSASPARPNTVWSASSGKGVDVRCVGTATTSDNR